MLVEYFSGRASVESILCGGYHSVAKLDNGTLLAWGCGEHGRLGQGLSEADAVVPRVIDDLNGQKVQKLFAGAYMTCAVCEEGAGERGVQFGALSAGRCLLQ
jgi:alpha-tubulin suppressor-like RCC1 family protein